MGIARSLSIILIVSFAAAGCVPPLGNISGDEPGTIDNLWAVPRRHVYELGDDFVPVDDVQVFASIRGTVETIDVNEVSIGLVTNPDSSGPKDPIEISDTGYRLTAAVGKGRKLVKIVYSDMSAEYSIEVQDPLDLTGDETDYPEDIDDGEGPGVGIIW